MVEFIAITLAGIFIYWVWLGYTGRDNAGDSDSKSRSAKYPVMTMEMIDSGGKPINSATAVKLFKEFMRKVGYLEKNELAEHAEYFTREMKEQGESLAEDVAHEKDQWSETIANTKRDIADLKKQMADNKDEAQRTELADDITDLEEEIKAPNDDIEYAKAALRAFKTDKREFLVNYVNQQIHGSSPS